MGNAGVIITMNHTVEIAKKCFSFKTISFSIIRVVAPG